MTRRTVALVAAVTVAFVVMVVASVDWSDAATLDPARALTLGPLEAFVADRNGLLPRFDRAELILFLGAGMAGVASGLVVWWFRPEALTGRLIVFVGLLWIASGVRRSSDPALFTVGAVLTYTMLPLAIQIGLGYPTGRLRRSWERWCMALCWLLAVVGVASEWVFFDPRSADSIHPSTARHVLLIRDLPEVATIIQLGVGITTAALSVVLLVVLVSRWYSGTQRYRAEFTPVAVCGILVFTFFAVGLLVAANTGLAGPEYSWIFSLRTPTMSLLPLLVAFVVIRGHLARVAIRSAMIEIGAAPISAGFVDALRDALHDPSLVLWRYDDYTKGYVDDAGIPQHLSHLPPSRGATTLERDGAPAGAVVYDGSLAAHPELLTAVHSATTLALEHERLRDELKAQLIEVRRSRARIVTAGDVQRRRIERDLHDGAQQHIVAASIHLSRASHATRDPAVREPLTHAAAELRTALIELRDLARGVYPSVLADGGLAGALTSLAEQTPIPVEITDTTTRRPPAPVELAAYYIAAEAVTNARKHARPSHVSIQVRLDSTGLHLDIRDDGRGGAVLTAGGGLSGLSDRAIALGGTLVVDSPPGGGTALTVTLPIDGND